MQHFRAPNLTLFALLSVGNAFAPCSTAINLSVKCSIEAPSGAMSELDPVSRARGVVNFAKSAN